MFNSVRKILGMLSLSGGGRGGVDRRPRRHHIGRRLIDFCPADGAMSFDIDDEHEAAVGTVHLEPRVV
ncbi:MAG TPA: hypothetical protein DCS29_00460 [Candidatus Magasanikbacteria bacterium]|nr:hypothetical protein [Candidatus Magasanikbacteria bacterium]